MLNNKLFLRISKEDIHKTSEREKTFWNIPKEKLIKKKKRNKKIDLLKLKLILLILKFNSIRYQIIKNIIRIKFSYLVCSRIISVIKKREKNLILLTLKDNKKKEKHNKRKKREKTSTDILPA